MFPSLRMWDDASTRREAPLVINVRPHQAKHSLKAIDDASTSALVEMRRTLSFYRSATAQTVAVAGLPSWRHILLISNEGAKWTCEKARVS